MKKLVLTFSLLFAFAAANAQTDTLLQQYTGKYVFPDGSPVKEIGVVIQEGVLTATSVMGNSELRKTENKDVFEIVSFAGTATFKRNEAAKVNGVQIQVQDVNMEGTKTEESIAYFLRKREMVLR
jgi:hypothetical protein